MKQDIKLLEEEILKHKMLYYSGSPVISDEEYDILENKLKLICADSYVLAIVGSSAGIGKKVKHDVKMLSLEKKYIQDELSKWVDGNVVVGTKKIDGISCSLVFENGFLALCKTRGNGIFGEDITDKCQWIKSIPKKIDSKAKIEIRGEIYCSFVSFEKLKAKMNAVGEEVPSSPRNIVAGLMGRKEKFFLCEFLDFQAFDVVQKYDMFRNECSVFDFLGENNFKCADNKLIHSKDDLESFLNEVRVYISKGKYLIDGAVFTYNDFSLHKLLGETNHHPKYKMAFKFKSEAKEAPLIRIEWNISRNGVFTPVGIIEPTDLSGALVSRVTLHNFGNVKNNNLKSGDIIKVIRSGEVIPKFEEVTSPADGTFTHPKECIHCESLLKIDDIRLVCPTENCPGRIKFEILNFISKIGIDDLSEKRLIGLMENKLVNDISGLYQLTLEDMLLLPKTKQTLATKLLQSISDSRHVTLPVFLSALGLTGGALNKCEKIVAAGFDSIEKILNLSVDDLESIEGFAHKSSFEIVKSINERKELILKLLGLGFVIEKSTLGHSGSLSGLKFCVTGKLSKPRSEIQKAIKDNGGTLVSNVNKLTNVLICNDKESSSSKMKNAIKFDVKVISEIEFFELI
jgi:DNA ligase (NAD+)